MLPKCQCFAKEMLEICILGCLYYRTLNGRRCTWCESRQSHWSRREAKCSSQSEYRAASAWPRASTWLPTWALASASL